MNIDGESTLIIHTIEPKSMIQVQLGHLSVKNPHFKHYFFRNAFGEVEHYTLSIYHYFTEDFNEDNHKPSADKLLDKAWHWYMAYLKWEDEQN